MGHGRDKEMDMISVDLVVTKINQLNLKVKIAIVMILAVVLVFIGCIGDIKLRYQRLQDLQTQQKITALQIMQIKKGKSDKQRQQEFLSLQRQLRQQLLVASQLSSTTNPRELDVALWLKSISDAALSSRLTVVSLKPETLEQGKLLVKQDVTSQNIKVVVSGGYQQITDFFIALKQLKLLAQVTLFSLQPMMAVDVGSAGDANDANLLLSANIKLYTVAHKKHLSKVAIKHNPFDRKRNTTVAQLSMWESRDLRLLGILQDEGKMIGIVSDPGGKIHHVTVGAVIGTSYSKVKQITSEAIVTENANDNIYR